MLIPFSFMKTQVVKTTRQAVTNTGSASGPDRTSQTLRLNFTPAVDLNLTTIYLTISITESGYSVPLVTGYSIADASISSISSVGDKLQIRLYVSA